MTVSIQRECYYYYPLKVICREDLIADIYPRDETVIASVQAATKVDVDVAVKAAKAALKNPNWADIHPSGRGSLLRKLSDLVEEHSVDLATLEAWDSGKPYTVALNEDVAELCTCLRYFAGFADKAHGQIVDGGASKFAYTIREPFGVCGQIIPWNYPLMMAAWKLGPALAVRLCPERKMTLYNY